MSLPEIFNFQQLSQLVHCASSRQSCLHGQQAYGNSRSSSYTVHTRANSVCKASRHTAAAVAAHTLYLFLPPVFARPAGLSQQL